MKKLKKWAKRVLEYEGDGAWIFKRSNLQWVDDIEVVKQLPFVLRIFSGYVRLYNRVVGTKTILFGHGVYQALRKLGRDRHAQPVDIGGQKIWLDLRDPGAMFALNELTHGSSLTKLAEKLIRGAHVFIDVGANQGIFTSLAIRSAPVNAMLVAIEPQPSLGDCLQQTLSNSRRQSWLLIRSVVTDRPGHTHLEVPAGNLGEAHVSIAGSTNALKVEATTLDLALRDIPGGIQVVVKMDVEGGERKALLGGKEFFIRCKPYLLLEVNPEAMARYGYGTTELCQVLASLGYNRWSPVHAPNDQYDLDELPATYMDVLLTPGSN